MDQDFDYDHSGLNRHSSNDENEYQNIHFHNRLFDRDTLIHAHYDVNFLYVVKRYAGNDVELRQGWKADVRKIFQGHVRNLIEGCFEFRAIMPHDGIDPAAFFAENFRVTLGKVYSPYADVNGRHVYMLAVQKPRNIFDDKSLTPDGRANLMEQVCDENKATLQLVETAFYVTGPLKLGDDPSDALAQMARACPVVHGPSRDNAGLQQGRCPCGACLV